MPKKLMATKFKHYTTLGEGLAVEVHIAICASDPHELHVEKVLTEKGNCDISDCLNAVTLQGLLDSFEDSVRD